MSLRLLVMRHGKSDWTGMTHGDHQRPLAKRGIEAAKQMGKLLRQSGQLPERVISSTALRALQTSEHLIQGAGLKVELQTTKQFYEASPEQVLTALRQFDRESKSGLGATVMIVGHEPTSSELVSRLIGGGQVAFPTAAIARIDFEMTRWSDIRPGAGTLRWLLQPKFFKPR